MVNTIELDREADGRWIAEVLELYVVADRLEHGEPSAAVFVLDRRNLHRPRP